MPSFFTIFRWTFRIVSAIFEHKDAMDRTRAAAKEADRAGQAWKSVSESFKTGDYDAALAAVEGLKEGGRETADYCFMRGSLLLERGQLAEAEQLLRKSLDLESEGKLQALRYSSLGHLLMKTERYDQAMSCFENGLAKWPKMGSLRRDMAEVVLRRGGDPKQALRLAKQAVSEEEVPESSADGAGNINMAESLATLAWAVANSEGSRAEVDQLAARAVPLAGKDVVSTTAQVNYHVGLAYVALEDFNETKKYMEAAAQIDSKGRWGRDAKAMLEALCQHQ